MIDKICTFLTNKIRKEMPEIDDEKAEVINYGLQNIIGEVPKILILLVVSYVLGIFPLALFTFIVLLPYRGASGGVHLKTHLGCIIFTTLFYCVIPFISQCFILEGIIKYIVSGIVLIFGIIMIKLYAPADTEDVPVLSTKLRRKKKILSYITFILGIVVAIFIPNEVVSNILILANFVQTITITRFAYKLAKSKYGYEVYCNASTQTNC